MLRGDLEAAGIAYRDASGRVADFHALRHTFIPNLAAGGVHPKVAQSLARHSTITLTMNRYSHTHAGDEVAALGVLPDLTAALVDGAKTGTDDAHGRTDGAIHVQQYVQQRDHDSPRPVATHCIETDGDSNDPGAQKAPINAANRDIHRGNGEGGIRTRVTGLYPVKQFSKLSPSAARPPLQVLAQFTPIPAKVKGRKPPPRVLTAANYSSAAQASSASAKDN
jgi:hypothetical protein